MHQETEVLTPVEARQGTRTKLNYRVLVTSLAIITVVFALMYLAFVAQSPPAVTVP